MKKGLFWAALCCPLTPTENICFEQRAGWLETYYTSGGQINFGYCQTGRGRWTVTETSTGAAVCTAKSLKEAKAAAEQQTNYLAGKLAKKRPLIVSQQKALLKCRLNVHTPPLTRPKPAADIISDGLKSAVSALENAVKGGD